jgi:hypothetical protein
MQLEFEFVKFLQKRKQTHAEILAWANAEITRIQQTRPTIRPYRDYADRDLIFLYQY